ncbi:MAG: SNF2-related protein [bacterium]
MKISRASLRAFVPEHVFLQAEELHRNGAIKIHNRAMNNLQATVRDLSNSYSRFVVVRWQQEGRPRSQCSCYSHDELCLHAVALLLEILQPGNNGLIDDKAGAMSWANYVQGLPQLLATPQAPRTQTYRLMFFLRLKPSGWSLRPAKTYIKKNGQVGQRSQPAYSRHEFQSLNASNQEKQAIDYLAQLKAAAGYGSLYAYSAVPTYEFVYGAEVDQLFEILSSCTVFLEDDLELFTPLQFVEATAKLRFQLASANAEQNGGGDLFFFPQLQCNGHPEAFDGSYRVLSSNPLWLLRDDQVFRLSEAVPAAYLLPFTQKGLKLRIPREQAGDFLKALAPRLTPQVELTLPEELGLQTVRTLTGKRLYLQEHENTLRAELRFVYGEVEVKGGIGSQVSLEQARENGALWRVERDLASENAVHEVLLSARMCWEASNGFFFLKEEPLTWLFDELPKLAASGFEIFGEENLQRNRVNRATPAVRVAVSSDIDWFDLSLEIDFGGVMASLAELRTAIRNDARYLKLADGSLARIPEEWQKRFSHFFSFAEIKNGTGRIAGTHAMLIDALFDEAQDKRFDDGFKQRVQRLKNFDGIQEVPVPENFQGTLRPYQQAGLNWLGFLQEYGFNGCLADDMGLGKTVQALAFLLREKSRNGLTIPVEAGRPSPAKAKKKHGRAQKNAKVKQNEVSRTSLIVAPLSVLFNWERECAHFAPDLKLHIHHGLERARTAETFAQHDLVLTTYATMRNDIDFLKDFSFHYLILDESQNIKNPVSQTAKAAGILNSRHRLVLTGTPVENNTLELWSQFSFLNPGLLGSMHYFRSAFATPIERHQDESAATLLKRMIGPFLLRRKKEDVAQELPPKSEQIFYCAMSAPQKKFYEQVRDQCRAELMNLISTSGLQDARFKVLQGLTRLRQIACHPALLEEGRKKDSGKFESFLDLLREIVAAGHKVLVFSQFVRMLKIVAEALDKEVITYTVLTGATRNREACVEQFQNDPNTKVFLISLKAGGFGLNLTAADYVFIFDPWWNPAAERQAIDRAHRIGQNKNVFVYKMIARDTVEEKILELQKRKENLVSQLITTESGLFKHLTVEDIRGLFS